MKSTDLVTTYDIPSSKRKTIIFNRTMENPEEEAKKFCKENRMKFLGCKKAMPYSLHEWQHTEADIFEVECSSRTEIWWYEFGTF